MFDEKKQQDVTEVAPCFAVQNPDAPPSLNLVRFQLWRLRSSKASSGPANAISAKKLRHKI